MRPTAALGILGEAVRESKLGLNPPHTFRRIESHSRLATTDRGITQCMKMYEVTRVFSKAKGLKNLSKEDSCCGI